MSTGNQMSYRPPQQQYQGGGSKHRPSQAPRVTNVHLQQNGNPVPRHMGPSPQTQPINTPGAMAHMHYQHTPYASGPAYGGPSFPHGMVSVIQGYPPLQQPFYPSYPPPQQYQPGTSPGTHSMGTTLQPVTTNPVAHPSGANQVSYQPPQNPVPSQAPPTNPYQQQQQQVMAQSFSANPPHSGMGNPQTNTRPPSTGPTTLTTTYMQPQQQYSQPVSQYGQALTAATPVASQPTKPQRQPSKAIKIVDPDTLTEVDLKKAEAASQQQAAKQTPKVRTSSITITDPNTQATVQPPPKRKAQQPEDDAKMKATKSEFAAMVAAAAAAPERATTSPKPTPSEPAAKSAEQATEAVSTTESKPVLGIAKRAVVVAEPEVVKTEVKLSKVEPTMTNSADPAEVQRSELDPSSNAFTAQPHATETIVHQAPKSVKVQAPKPAEPQIPEPVEPQIPEPVEPQIPEPVEPQIPEPVEPQIPELVEPQIPEPVEPQIPEPREPQIPEPVKPQIPEPVKCQIPEPVKCQIPEPVKPQIPEPAEPQVPKPVQHQATTPLKPQAVQADDVPDGACLSAPKPVVKGPVPKPEVGKVMPKKVEFDTKPPKAPVEEVSVRVEEPVKQLEAPVVVTAEQANEKESVKPAVPKTVEAESKPDIAAPQPPKQPAEESTADKQVTQKTDAELMPPPENKAADNKPTLDLPKANGSLAAFTKRLPNIGASRSMSAAIPSQLNSSQDPTARPQSSKASTQELDAEGKKIYTRDFLLELRKRPLSQQKPEGLESPDLKHLQEKPDFARKLVMETNRRGAPDFTPDFFRSSTLPQRPSASKNRGGPPRHTSMHGGHGGHLSRPPPPGPITIDYVKKNVKLHKAENAWKPADKQANPDKSAADIAHDELCRNFRGQLNKITPQNFDRLSAKVMELPVHTEQDLDAIMNLVFEKAIGEPNFSNVYAKLCHKIAMHFQVPQEADEKQTVVFRKLLLVRCQREFEDAEKNELVVSAKKEAIDNAATPEEKETLTEEYVTFEFKSRKRRLGNIRFIGELFKLGMLVAKIMHSCIVQLLKTPNEENLECLCKLFTTMGQQLDDPKAKHYNNQYFNKMKEIIDQKKVASRIRFTLQDVIDLRANDWVPRRDGGNNPKTLKQIHAEAAIEQHESQILAQNFTQNQQQRAPQNRPGGNIVVSRSGSRTGNEYHGAASKLSSKFEAEKMKVNKMTTGGDFTLGPSKSHSSWTKGSGSVSGKNTSTSESTHERSVTPNRFAQLQGEETSYLTTRNSGSRNASNRGASRGRGGYLTPRGSREKEQQRERSRLPGDDTVKMLRQISRGDGSTSANSSRGPSRNNSTERKVVDRRDRTSQPPKSESASKPAREIVKPDAVKQLSREDWEQKIKSILDEYIHNKDLAEAVACVQELLPQSNLHLLVDTAINCVLERSSSARKHTGRFLSELVELDILSMEHYTKGCLAVLEFASDLVIDIPTITSDLAELISPIFVDAHKSMSLLRELSQPLKECNLAHKFAADMLKETAHSLGRIDVAKMWRDNKLSLKEHFLPSDEDETTFLKEKGLEWLNTVETAAASNSTGKSLEDIAKEIEVHFGKPNADNDTVFDMVDAGLSTERRKQEDFIKMLSGCVVASCVNPEMELNEENLSARLVIMKKYIDTDQHKQQTALNAVEELVSSLKHPKSLLCDIFYVLANDDLVSEEAFKQWKEQSSNGVAIQSLKSFFKWLDEPVEEDQQ